MTCISNLDNFVYNYKDKKKEEIVVVTPPPMNSFNMRPKLETEVAIEGTICGHDVYLKRVTSLTKF